METIEIFDFISTVCSLGALIGVMKISWMQDDIRTEIREIKAKLNSL